MSPALSVVREAAPAEPSRIERIRQLQAETKVLAREHVAALVQAIGDVASLAAEVADGGDVFPAGVRDLARRFAEDCETRVQTLEAISARSGT